MFFVKWELQSNLQMGKEKKERKAKQAGTSKALDIVTAYFRVTNMHES